MIVSCGVTRALDVSYFHFTRVSRTHSAGYCVTAVVFSVAIKPKRDLGKIGIDTQNGNIVCMNFHMLIKYFTINKKLVPFNFSSPYSPDLKKLLEQPRVSLKGSERLHNKVQSTVWLWLLTR